MLLIPALAACDSGDSPADTTAAPDITTVPGGEDKPLPEDPNADYLTEGDFGYVVLEDGTAKVVKYLGQGGKVVIPDTLGGKSVSKLGLMVFANNLGITAVELPGSLTDTGELSFFGCREITSVVIGEGVTTIARGSFNYCEAITEMSLPSTVTRIEELAFQSCKSLQNVTIPDAVTHIGMRAFANSGLVHVDLPTSLASVGSEVFLGCESLVDAVFHSSMSRLNSDFFAYCYSLKNVVFPEGITYLDTSMFFRCTAMEVFVFPSTVRETGERVFYGCQALKEVYIPEECADEEDDLDIGYYNFWFAPALTDVYFGGTEAQWAAILDGISDRNQTLYDSTTVHFGAEMPQ